MKGEKVLKQGKRACSDAEEAGAELTVWRNRNIVKKICCARLEATTALLLLHPVGHSLCRFSGVWESCCLPASRSSGCICDGPVGSAWACDRWAAVNSPRHFDIAAWFLNCCGKSASGSQLGKYCPLQRPGDNLSSKRRWTSSKILPGHHRLPATISWCCFPSQRRAREGLNRPCVSFTDGDSSTATQSMA